jgi:hypothetical protein
LPRVGRRWALLLTALWFAVLIALIILLAAEPKVGFRYDDL